MAQSQMESKACVRFQGCWKCPRRLYHSCGQQLRTESRGSFCGYSYQHNVVAQHHELPEQAGEVCFEGNSCNREKLSYSFWVQCNWWKPFWEMPRSVSHGHKAPKPKPDALQLRALHPDGKESSVPVSAALPRQHCEFQTRFRRRSGEYKRLRRAASLQKMWRTGRYGSSSAFPENRPTKQ